MDNRLIFLYHRVRAKAKATLLREPLRGLPTHVVEATDGETQEGRWTRALVVPG
jgi:hypothetical protein